MGEITQEHFRPKKLENTRDAKIVWEHIESGCRRIGIIGNYGTGKSSIIKTLEEYNKKIELVTLSSAIFNDTDVDCKYTNQDIEKVFIQQLQMILEGKTYISNNLRLKKNIDIDAIKVTTILIGVSTWLYVNISLYIKYINDRAFKLFSNSINIEKVILLVVFNIATVLLLIGIYKMIIKLLENYDIKRIDKDGLVLEKYMRDIELNESSREKNDVVELSAEFEFRLIIELLNEVYESQCKQGEYLVISIEDLDRHSATEVFDYLYRICNIYQNSDKKIVFIFSIQSNTINKDETKYFDAIIDVIPHYDSVVAADLINDLLVLRGYKLKFAHINNLVTYIPDYRVALRVINKFDSYYTISTNKEQLNLDKLFAISLITILYPEELAIVSKEGEYKSSKSQELLAVIQNKLISEIKRDDTFIYSEQFKYIFEGIVEEDGDITDDETTKLWNSIKKDKKLSDLLKYCIMHDLLDNDFSEVISIGTNIFAHEVDNQFVTNYIHKNGIFNDGKTELSNIQEIVERYITPESLKLYPELINDKLLEYFWKNEMFEEFRNLHEMYLNKRKIRDIIENQELDIFNNPDFFKIFSEVQPIQYITEFKEKDHVKILEGKAKNIIMSFYSNCSDELDTHDMNGLPRSYVNKYFESGYASNGDDMSLVFDLISIYDIPIKFKLEHLELFENEGIEFTSESMKFERDAKVIEHIPKIDFDEQAISKVEKCVRIDNSYLFKWICDNEIKKIKLVDLGETFKQTFLSYLSNRVETNILEMFMTKVEEPYDFILADIAMLDSKEIDKVIIEKLYTSDIKKIREMYDAKLEQVDHEIHIQSNIIKNIDHSEFIRLFESEEFIEVKDEFQLAYILNNKVDNYDKRLYIENIMLGENRLNYELIEKNIHKLNKDIIRIFEFDFENFLLLFNEDEETALKYILNMTPDYITDFEYEDLEVFERLCNSDTEAVNIESYLKYFSPVESQKIDTSEMSIKAINKLCKLSNEEKYELLIDSVISILKQKDLEVAEVIELIQFAAFRYYPQTKTNCLVDNEVIIGNSKVFEQVAKKLNYKYIDFEQYLNFISANIDNIESVFEFIMNCPFAGEFEFIKPVLNKVSNNIQRQIPEKLNTEKGRVILQKMSYGNFNLADTRVTSNVKPKDNNVHIA